MSVLYRRMMAVLAPSPTPSAPANIGYAIGFENAIEQREPVPLRVKGQIPTWLTGSLYRTGPGTFRVPSASPAKPAVNIAHWFDGLGMNHRFQIMPDGSVLYRSHSSAMGLHTRIAQSGTVPGFTFGTQDPCETIFSKFFTVFRPQLPSPSQGAPDDQNISVTLSTNMDGIPSHHSSSSLRNLVAKSDNNILQILNPDTLQPIRATTYAEFDRVLDGQISAAHSCRDNTTGEFFNFSLKLGRRPVYKVFRIKPGEKDGPEPDRTDHAVDVLAEIVDAPAAYLHSFAMTQKYVVLCVWQADFTYSGASIVFNRNIAGSINKKWNPKRNALFYVIDRHNGGVVAKYETPPFFAFHQINSYDSGTDDIVLDLSVYDDHSVIDLFYLDNLRNLDDHHHMKAGCARRFVLEDVRGGHGTTRQAKVMYTIPETYSIELPTVHPGRYHKPYRFAYGINKSDTKKATFADGLIKLDLSNPEAKPKTWGAPGYTPGEPIFVPRPRSSSETPVEDAEDDGVLLSVVLDAEKQKSMLVILDAKEMKEEARAEMDSHFPFSFHGTFVPVPSL
ncbi:hypothetical protein AcV7_007097 [Taiwanofungus camphoratus]|nr:hypothetical protein AcV7_007097 [Antrodia cinnamomea]